MTKVFIDGSAGTTGLRIYERLGSRTDIELMILPEESRKTVRPPCCVLRNLTLPEASR